MTKNKTPSALATYKDGKRKDRPFRSLYVSFRVTSDEKAAILANARLSGHKPSDFCPLRCLKQPVVNISEAARRERRVFINMANNINQMARRINTEGAHPRLVAELEQLLDNIKKQKEL
jgi:hypothetical protein